MMLDKQPYTFDRVFRIAFAIILLWAAVKLVAHLSDVLIPFAVALLLAYLINPLVVLLQKKIRRRGPAVFVALLIVSLVGTGVGAVIVPLVVSDVVELGATISRVVTDSNLATTISARMPSDMWEEIRSFIAREDVQSFFRTENFFTTTKTVLQKVLPGVWDVIAGTTSIIVGIIGVAVVALYLIFLLLDYGLVKDRWKHLLPQSYREPIIDFIGEFEAAMNRHFRGQAVIAAIVGVSYAVGFLIIGLPMAILLGLFIGLLNMVPFLQIVGLVPAYAFSIVDALESGRSVWLNLSLLTAVVIVSEVIQSAVLVPRIQGKVTGLAPVVILLSLSIWGKLLGFLGLLIALPMTCLVLAYYQRLLASMSTRSK
jgi:predicted PurR-regulated permease PerM